MKVIFFYNTFCLPSALCHCQKHTALAPVLLGEHHLPLCCTVKQFLIVLWTKQTHFEPNMTHNLKYSIRDWRHQCSVTKFIYSYLLQCKNQQYLVVSWCEHYLQKLIIVYHGQLWTTVLLWQTASVEYHMLLCGKGKHIASVWLKCCKSHSRLTPPPHCR